MLTVYTYCTYRRVYTYLIVCCTMYVRVMLVHNVAKIAAGTELHEDEFKDRRSIS